MEALTGRLSAALAGRYALERELGQGGMVFLFTGNNLTNSRHATWDVDPSGRRFVFVTGDQEGAVELILVQNLVASRLRATGK